MIKKFLKAQISKIDPDIIERALGLSFINHKFSEFAEATHFNSREELWLDGLNRIDKSDLTFLEFGVWQGYSIKYFAKQVKDVGARFYGFDSFEGLPEDWIADRPKGMFGTGGIMPVTDDERIKFVKGWFQDSLPGFLSENPSRISSVSLIAHYDADLYSSTLFCLSQIDAFKREYIAIFDEFSGHETRALHNYLQTYGAKVKFLGRTGGQDNRWPVQVMCLITPS